MKKIYYFTIAAFAMVVLTFVSCKKDVENSTAINPAEQNSTIQVKNGRLILNSIAALDSLVTSFNTKTSIEIDEFETKLNFKSYRRYAHDIDMENWYNFKTLGDTITPCIEYKKMPDSYAAVLNPKGEFQIKDSVYFFKNNSVFIIPFQNEEILQVTEKELSSSLTKTISANIRCLQYKSDTLSRKTGNIKNTLWPNVDARYQYTYNNGSFTFKIVFESIVGGFNASTCTYTVNNKLEYRKNGYWYPAGEYVYKYTSVTCYTGGENGGLGGPSVVLDNSTFSKSWTYPHPVSYESARIQGTMKSYILPYNANFNFDVFVSW